MFELTGMMIFEGNELEIPFNVEIRAIVASCIPQRERMFTIMTLGFSFFTF